MGGVGPELTNEKDTVEVEEEGDEGTLSGHYPKNFSIMYAEGTEDEDTTCHYLDLDMYLNGAAEVSLPIKPGPALCCRPCLTPDPGLLPHVAGR